MIIKNERKGEITAHFANGESQKLVLDGLLLRPKLELLTEKSSKNDKAMDELDMGVVNVDKFRTIKVFLSNVTEPTAKWKLNYVSFPKKSTIGYSTLTPWEQENMEKTDDPDVFEFSVTDVSFLLKSILIRALSEENRCHLERFLKGSACHLFPKMRKKENSCLRPFSLTSE